MLYLVKWESFDLFYLLFALGLVIAIILFFKIRKYIKYDKHIVFQNVLYYHILRYILLFLSVVLSIVCIMGVGEKIYILHCYENENYYTVEGSIEDLEYIYENNSSRIRGIRFKVNEILFSINNNILHSGYSLHDGIINKDGDEFKIYYIPLYIDDEINLIVRIDAITK